MLYALLGIILYMVLCVIIMNCPYCNSENTLVIDSRENKAGRSIRRRRECPVCKKRFTTYETVVGDDFFVIKKDGKRELYNQKKLEKGIFIAFNKLNISVDVIEKAIRLIEEEIKSKSRREIDSTEIGNIVLSYLKEISLVAYVRFASVYKKFQTKEDFIEEIEGFR